MFALLLDEPGRGDSDYGGHRAPIPLGQLFYILVLSRRQRDAHGDFVFLAHVRPAPGGYLVPDDAKQFPFEKRPYLENCFARLPNSSVEVLFKFFAVSRCLPRCSYGALRLKFVQKELKKESEESAVPVL